MIGSAFAFIVLDAIFGFPMWLRCFGLAGWIGLGVYELRRFFKEVLTEPIDAEGVACAVEQEYPRLSERLSTAVELAGCDDPANGSPELIADVVNDVEIRTRKLDLQRAAASTPTIWYAVITGVAALVVLLTMALASGAGEQLRRFFLPFYAPKAPTVEVGYKVVVTSGDPVLKRGESTDLAGHLETIKAGTVLPTSATLIVKTATSEQRLPMEFDTEKGVIHLKQGPIDAAFDYCIESGQAVSEWHKVTVIEPIRLEEITATITPPPYAFREGDVPVRVQGLGEIQALQYSRITWDIKFSRVPGKVWVEWRPNEPEKVPSTERTRLTIDEWGRTSHSLVVVPPLGGEIRLVVDAGKAGTTFPSQTIRITVDAPPKFERVDGVLTETRFLAPGAKLPIDVTVSDDISVAKLEVEYRVNQGPIQKMPLQPKGLGTNRVNDAIELDVASKAKEGEIFEYRLVATDNRNIPEAKLTPQQAYYPSEKWSEIRFSKNAPPLKEQDILAKKKEVDERLQRIIRELEAEERGASKLKTDTANEKKLSPENSNKLDEVSKQVRETGDGLKELAGDIGLTPDLAELSEEAGKVAENELKEADAALNQARKQDRPDSRTKDLEKADTQLGESIRKLEQLRKLNERLAQARLDRERLERLLAEQQKLKEELEKAKDNPEQLARLQEAQRKLEEQLKKLAEESDLAKQALKDSLKEKAEQAAKKAEELEQQQRDLNQATKQTEKENQEQNSADLLRKQEELNKKIKDFANKTDSATRVGQVDPLQPNNSEKASKEIKEGNFDKAVEEQEKSAQELSRVARELDRAAKQARDPRKAAEQLQRLQKDLKDRMQAATKDKPLELLTPQQKQQLLNEQEAIRKAVEGLSVPPEANKVKQKVLDEIDKTEKALKNDDLPGAEKGMDATAKALEKLTEQLPSQEKRLEQARKEMGKIKKDQDEIAGEAERKMAAAAKQDPDKVANQQELSKKLADTAKKQADNADKLSKLDTPGLEERKEKAQEAMRKAQNDLADGKPQDIQASQQAAKRELDRFEQALNGQTPADEKADQLAKKQKQIADELKKKPDAAKTKELQQQQAELQKDLDKLQAPEAAAQQDDAQRLTRQTESALRENNVKEAADQAEKAAAALQRMADQMNGRQTEKEKVDELAKKQKQNAEQAEKKNPQAMNEERKRAQQVQDELSNVRPGEEGQKDKQKALDALKKAQQARNPEEMAKAQKEAEEALNDLADRLTREKPPEEKDAEKLTRDLAKKQRDLANKTKEKLDAAKMKEGEEGKKATEEALQKAAEEQRKLNKEASELPTNDTPQALDKAKGAMNQAEQAATAKNEPETLKKQREAADALDQLAKQVGEQAAKKPAPGEKGTDSLPNQLQSEQAKKLAEEQRKLRDQAKKKAEEQAGQAQEHKENPIGPLVKEQEEIAKQAEGLTKSVEQQQGENAEGTKQAKQAAEAAKQATNQLKKGELEPARQAGRQAAQKMQQMAQGSPDSKSGKEAAELAKRQEELNKKLEAVGDDNQAAQAQQREEQDKLQGQAQQLQRQIDELAKQAKQQPGSSSAASKLEQGSGHLQQANEALQNAKQQAKQGKPDQARQSRDDASRAMEQARQQASEAAKELGEQAGKQGGEARAGDALQQAKDEMAKAQKELGQGKPGEAGKSMDQASKSLKQASQQIGRGQGQGQNQGQTQGGQTGKSGQADPNGKSANKGAGSANPDLTQFEKIMEKYPGKSWGELPGKVQNDVIQEMAARYGEEYARNIRLYFEQLAERK
jgi:hypothetical protein